MSRAANRHACSRACAAQGCPVPSAGSAGCGPAPGSGSSRPRTAPSPYTGPPESSARSAGACRHSGRGSGTIGAARVARAFPDGYTLLAGSNLDQAAALALFKNLPYDPAKDFVAVAITGRTCQVLLVHPSLGVRTPQESIDLARSKPGILICEYSGLGTPQQVLMEQLKRSRKVEIIGVQYKGSAPGCPVRRLGTFI
jgi:hypothetical protein